MTIKQVIPVTGWDAIMDDMRIPVVAWAVIQDEAGEKVVGLIPDAGLGLTVAEDATASFTGYLHKSEELITDAIG